MYILVGMARWRTAGERAPQLPGVQAGRPPMVGWRWVRLIKRCTYITGGFCYGGIANTCLHLATHGGLTVSQPYKTMLLNITGGFCNGGIAKTCLHLTRIIKCVAKWSTYCFMLNEDNNLILRMFLWYSAQYWLLYES